MDAIVESVSDNLPAEPIDFQEVKSVKQNVYSDISPLLGLNPIPKRNVIALQLTVAPAVYYLGVEREAGWQTIAHFDASTSASDMVSASKGEQEDMAKHPELGEGMKQALDTSVKWANTYYHGESVALVN